MNNEQQTQQADDPSDDRYWRNVLPSEILQPDDMMRTMAGLWLRTTVPGKFARDGCGRTYRRRIEPQPEAQPQPQPEPQATQDDPSGEGWRWVSKGDTVREGDMWSNGVSPWSQAERVGETVQYNAEYRRRIKPQQASDSEPETMDDLLRRLAECEVLLAECERGGQQVNAELQQLREQVLALTLERDRLQSWLQQHHTTGQQSAIKKLERWLKPVVKVVADHPDHSSILAVSVLEFLPQIASRLIEE